MWPFCLCRSRLTTALTSIEYIWLIWWDRTVSCIIHPPTSSVFASPMSIYTCSYKHLTRKTICHITIPTSSIYKYTATAQSKSFNDSCSENIRLQYGMTKKHCKSLFVFFTFHLFNFFTFVQKSL